MRLKQRDDLVRDYRVATRGRQGGFLILTLLSWSLIRGYLLWPNGQDAIRGASMALAPAQAKGLRAFQPLTGISPPFDPAPWARQPNPKAGPKPSDWGHGINAARWLLLQLGGGETVSIPRALRRATFAYQPPAQGEAAATAPPAPAPLFPEVRARRSGLEAQAYLFWRPGAASQSLAEHGELGGSQVAARIAMPLGHGIGAAARIYAPLERKGAEAAIGIDWHPLAGQPLRISIERRQRLDSLGRSAWSAYAAGGFYRGGGAGHAAIDGYAQAGIVGVQRHDLFVDGALRIGYQLPTRRVAIVAGAGLWGAAQPQLSRLDVGPRFAITLPVDRHSLTFELDGRLRAAGNARPGSGAALTIATDF